MLALASASFAYTAPIKMGTNPDAPIKLGVNGFGRIGRQVVRIAMDRDSFVLKHINSPMSPEYMKYLLEHDTVHGRFSGTCEVDGDALIINGAKVTLSATRVPAEIPWRTGVEPCASRGRLHDDGGRMAHIEGGARTVTRMAKDADTPTLSSASTRQTTRPPAVLRRLTTTTACAAQVGDQREFGASRPRPPCTPRPPAADR